MHEDHIISLKTPATKPAPIVEESRPLPPPRPRRRRGWKQSLAILCGLALIGLVFLGCYSLFARIGSVMTQVNPGSAQDVVAHVGQLMLLPNETPTIAVVSDLDKLKGQQFFAHAHLGDIVLMYAHADKAILYSPSQNKIIEVAPIAAGEQPQ